MFVDTSERMCNYLNLKSRSTMGMAVWFNLISIHCRKEYHNKTENSYGYKTETRLIFAHLKQNKNKKLKEIIRIIYLPLFRFDGK